MCQSTAANSRALGKMRLQKGTNPLSTLRIWR
jgi:hypothetical protein